eukprot:7714891-Pyramimonas_sp.AAC.1
MQTVLAGDAFAAAFMKVMLLEPLGAMRIACPAVPPAVVVDDVVLQRWGGAERVAKDLAQAAKIGQGPCEGKAKHCGPEVQGAGEQQGPSLPAPGAPGQSRGGDWSQAGAQPWHRLTRGQQTRQQHQEAEGRAQS